MFPRLLKPEKRPSVPWQICKAGIASWLYPVPFYLMFVGFPAIAYGIWCFLTTTPSNWNWLYHENTLVRHAGGWGYEGGAWMSNLLGTIAFWEDKDIRGYHWLAKFIGGFLAIGGLAYVWVSLNYYDLKADEELLAQLGTMAIGMIGGISFAKTEWGLRRS